MSRDWYPLRNHPDYTRRHHPQVGDTIAINGLQRAQACSSGG